MGIEYGLEIYPQNPRYRYSVVSENFYKPELGEYRTYGVQVITPEYTDILHDVSSCEKTVRHIVELLNRGQVSPLHLYDVISDMLP